MKIAAKKVVSLQYTLKNNKGEIIDSNLNQDPLVYVHGVGMLVQGLENELEGRTSGEKFLAQVEPSLGYGEKSPDLIQAVSRTELPHLQELEVGMLLESETADGHPVQLTVISFDDHNVTLDANHPLAGEDLHFEVEITNIRDMTEDEQKQMPMDS